MGMIPPKRARPTRHHSSDAEFARLQRRLRHAIGVLVLLTVVGVLGFVIIARGEHGVIDAIYMTVITLTTVGFSEIIDMTNNPAGRIFTVLLLLSGMGIVAYTVPMVAGLLIEGQLHHIFARRRMQKTISQMSDHYIVGGDSASRWYVVEELLGTHRPVMLVTPSEDLLADIQERARAFRPLSATPATGHFPTCTSMTPPAPCC